MNTDCLNYLLTEEEHRQFEDNGYFIVEDAIPPDLVKRLTIAVDHIDAQERAANGRGPSDGQNILDFIGRDEIFLELLDWPKTFPKVFGILGWNIQLYHSHVIITPPKATTGPGQQGLNWHKDSGRLNKELETNPQPRISLKVAYFLTDTSELGRANLYVIPGSHLQNTLHIPEAGEPAGSMAVRVRPGTAVFFDRRIWHASSPNHSNIPRKVLFYGYSYRWLRPRDDMSVGHYLEGCDPIRRQLLGVSLSGGHGYSSPQPEDVPLRAWMEEHLGLEMVPA
jgi:ectoine hydroxylase-related dioxygenase (phytanoyl-CoA dioxygenase family)